MSVFELFSRRRKKQSDVLQYDDLPEAFRVQVVHIWRDCIGGFHSDAYDDDWKPNVLWKLINKTMTRELGQYRLSGRRNVNTSEEDCVHYLHDAPADDALDIIDLSFGIIEVAAPDLYGYSSSHFGIALTPGQGISELNQRFAMHGIGYAFENGQLIRKDSDFLHARSTKPALALLHTREFRGAEKEFLKAHENYRKGDYRASFSMAGAAFESVLKTICGLHKWQYPPNASASGLIEIVFDKGLIPKYLQSQFHAVRTTLECGLPTVRNREGPHGQGEAVKDVPDYLVAYALHLCAANIVMLVQAHKG